MPRQKTGMAFMKEFVQGYLNGSLERLDWDLDFIHYLIKHYPKMEREDAEAAECFNFFFAERGFDHGMGLTDVDHKNHIKQCFDDFLSAEIDGFL